MNQKENKTNSQLVSIPFVAVVITAIVGYMIIFVTPVLGEAPVEITEELEILAVTEKGVVFETSMGIAIITDQYDGEPGDIIEVTYSVPAKFFDDKRKLQLRFDNFHPNSEVT